MSAPRFLHLHAAFEGPAALRCARLANAFGREAQHAIVSGDPARRGAAAALDGKAKVTWPKFPPLAGKPWPGRLKKLAEAMQGYDLVCTYGWGAIDAPLAHTMFADVFKLPPLVHHEDDAAGRTFYRRIALGRTRALIVPSRTLERVALDAWQQPRGRVRRIPHALATKAFGKKARAGLLPNLIKRREEFWIGTTGDAALPGELPAIVRGLARLPEPWHLVIAGDPPGREAIQQETRASEVEHRVHLVGAVDPVGLTALLDLFVVAASAETFPLSVIEAMAAGLPIAAPATGDVSAMVAGENLPFIVAQGNAAALGEVMAILAGDAALREKVGKANRMKAREEFDEARMIERFRTLYWGVLAGSPG